jgi:hypothetical protein
MILQDLSVTTRVARHLNPATLALMTAAPTPDPIEIRRALAVIHPEPTDVIELRAIGVRGPRLNWPSTTSGYFLDRQKCAEAAAELSPLAEGVYITLNRINPSLLARAVDRVRTRGEATETTADHHVTRRLWLPIDVDPVRPAGISSTNGERALALETARTIRTTLLGEGWAAPVLADSGNGTHLLFPIDRPADDEGYVKRVLGELSVAFSTAAVKVDVAVFNPARIWKLYGTLARKGDHAPVVGRPHRQARLLEAPDATAA